MGLINDKYFKSEAIKVFPASYRTINKTDAERFTEYNLLRTGGKLNPTDSYVIDYVANNSLICVIGGYYFEIDLITAEITAASLANKYLCITLNDKKLSSFEAGSTNLDNDINSNGTSAFTGLKVTDDPTGSSAFIKPFNENNALDYTLKIPSVSAGSAQFDNAVVLNNSNDITNKASGDASFAHGVNTEASGKASHAEGIGTVEAPVVASGKASHAEGYGTKATGNYSHTEGDHTIASRDNQTVVGKYNKEEDGEFIVGSGSAAKKKNALVVNGDTTTIYEKLKIKTDTKEVLKVTDAETSLDSETATVDSDTLDINSIESTNINSKHISIVAPEEGENLIQASFDLTAEEAQLITKNNENITLSENKVKIGLHKGDTSHGKLIIKKVSNKTNAELDADTIDLKGDTTVTGDLTATSNNVKLGIDVANTTKASISITNESNTHKVNINGATKINNTLETTGTVKARSSIHVGGTETVHGTISYAVENNTKKVKINAVDSELVVSAPDNKNTGIKIKENNKEVELAEKVKNIIFEDIQKAMFNNFYPVGAFYISYSINKNTINEEGKWGCPIAAYGGYWERVQDTFLYAACESYPWESTVDNPEADWPWPSPRGSNDAVVVSHTHEMQEAGNHSHTAKKKTLTGSFITRACGASNASMVADPQGNVTIQNDTEPSAGLSVNLIGASGSPKSDRTIIDMTHTHTTTEEGEHTHIINNIGENGKDKNMPRYICVYMWRRTA